MVQPDTMAVIQRDLPIAAEKPVRMLVLAVTLTTITGPGVATAAPFRLELAPAESP